MIFQPKLRPSPFRADDALIHSWLLGPAGLAHFCPPCRQVPGEWRAVFASGFFIREQRVVTPCYSTREKMQQKGPNINPFAAVERVSQFLACKRVGVRNIQSFDNDTSWHYRKSLEQIMTLS